MNCSICGDNYNKNPHTDLGLCTTCEDVFVNDMFDISEEYSEEEIDEYSLSLIYREWVE